ncbi:MAG: outer membrane beta-barrel protein, partial [Rhizobium sp.]|nr:outer membrane beta-barrel protein [Rhizobium sp.]
VEHDFGRLRGTIAADITRLQYSDAELSDGTTLSLSDRDRQTGELRGRIGYEISPALTPLVEVAIGKVTNDEKHDTSGNVRSDDTYSARGGIAADFGDKLKGELGIGYERQRILEEPPKRAMFLVLSHAPGKLLPTIRSRCLPLKLSALSDEAMRQALGQLGLSIPQGQAETVLSLSKGSVAQALKLANYGGADLIEAFRKLLGEQGPAARKTMYKLADALSAKDSDVAFGFFTEHLGEFLMDEARSAALSGDLARAEHYSRLSASITEQLGIAAAYNLERKQTMLDVLSSVTG